MTRLHGLLTLALALLAAPLKAEPLIIVSEPWPPYVFAENNVMRGVDYEVSDRLLRELGYQPEWRMMPWKRALHEVREGHADAILDVGINDQRRQEYHYPSEPLSHSETVLFYRKARPFPFTGIADLSGLRIGISAGYSYGNAEFKAADNFERWPCPSIETCLLMLEHGRIDMLPINRRVGLYSIRQLALNNLIAHHQTALSSGELYLAFARRPALAELADRFGDALQQFKQSDDYQQLLQQYGVR